MTSGISGGSGRSGSNGTRLTVTATPANGAHGTNGTCAGGARAITTARDVVMPPLTPATSLTAAFPLGRPSDEMLERIAALDAVRMITTPRWEPVRAIVVNYFVIAYYEFHFLNGCVVLGGGNGTGKTSLLTALVTMVLDNDKRPERLDPSRSRDRNIGFYMLGMPE